ncbi:Hypothetical predicted protein [Cloeon dipterum]|uniref:RRM domain-containing protein n=1 Tax=Cloeon dipterum TaxID=197152 RepID=A0A8S1BLU9_9INSE|nr:Hypothetical predicted protein [Cloeon dipterum]
MHVHRFYNENSSFIHGGLDNKSGEQSVVGQRQIHQLISQLGFSNCHAKIQQVDAQCTLGNGVVVQVTGELSNDSEPMRRFTQTFVLAQQSPKKYYVHNDIFRYQDEMVNDDDPGNYHNESEADLAGKEVPVITQPNIIDYYNDAQPATVTTVPIVRPGQGNIHMPVIEVAGTQPGVQIAPPSMQMAQPGVQVTQVIVAPTTTPTVMEQAPPMPVQQQQQQQLPMVTPIVSEVKEIVAPLVEPKIEEAAPAPQQPKQPQVVAVVEENKGPKTFASMFKKGGPSGPQQPLPPQRVRSPTVQVAEHAPKSTSPPSSQQGHGLPPRQGMNKQGMGNKPGRGPMRGSDGEKRESMGRDREPGPDDRRRSVGGPNGPRHPDSHQVFVGNIPIVAQEADVKNVFCKFGNVVDVRIINSKVVPGKVFPKYGFVVFSDAEAAQNCLRSKPIMMPGESPQNLNVEEKRPRYPANGGNNDRGNMAGSNRGGRGQRNNYDRADR